jgi:hypothetical protein
MSKYAQRVHKLLNTVRRQIQLGSFLIFGQWCGVGFASSVTRVIAGSLDKCRICLHFVQPKGFGLVR